MVNYLVEVNYWEGNHHKRVYKICGNENTAIHRLSDLRDKMISDRIDDGAVFEDTAQEIILRDGYYHEQLRYRKDDQYYFLTCDVEEMTVEN